LRRHNESLDGGRPVPLIERVRDLRRSLAPWLIGFVLWTGLALLSVAERIIWLSYRAQPIDLSDITIYALADWYACGIFVPVLVVATRRWPLDRRHVSMRLPLHAGLLLAVVVAKIALFHQIRPLLLPGNDLTFAGLLAGSAISETIAFGAVAGVLHAAEFYRRYRERETFAIQLQARLSDAQLRALRAQLNPHFLFNTLNAATALMHRDPDAADAMLTRLGELLRLTLRADPQHETPLREEISLLERYLAIMQIRFADRVTVRCVVDPQVADALVPSFILQPIVENAFEHGVARLQRAGTIEISATSSGGMLVLRVHDDGPGPAGAEPRAGVGLANARTRLAELYGAEGSLEFLASQGGGTTVEVRLPLRTAALAA
jgi:sensor histidine kinase YesM